MTVEIFDRVFNNDMRTSCCTIWSIIAASVVDLPEPVGPVISTRPRGREVKSARIEGSPSSAMLEYHS